MIFVLTSIFFQNLAALRDPNCRIVVNEGGTSSSKTYSILQLLINVCQQRTKPLLVSVVSESMPHIKRGVERDFFTLLGDSFIPTCWNATDRIYNFGAAQMEFFSADIPGKVRGPRRDILYLNEANNISKSAYDELSIRTRRFEFIDHNPVAEYWAHELQKETYVKWIHSTYLDAMHVLPKEVVSKIEAKRLTDPNWWNVYGLGKVGNIEGLIHPLFTQCDLMPKDCGDYFYGLDFGYTNDPTGLVRNIIIGDTLYSEELIYETGLKSQPMIERLDKVGIKRGYDEIFGDAADPRLIDEISDAGFNIKPAPKGEDSVRYGIQLVNNYKQVWVKRSLNGIKEQRNYRYIQDKNGKYTNKPIGTWNHLMDARRYALVGKLSAPGLPGVFSL
jgi:phage terminase large subunit